MFAHVITFPNYIYSTQSSMCSGEKEFKNPIYQYIGIHGFWDNSYAEHQNIKYCFLKNLKWQSLSMNYRC